MYRLYEAVDSTHLTFVDQSEDVHRLLKVIRASETRVLQLVDWSDELPIILALVKDGTIYWREGYRLPPAPPDPDQKYELHDVIRGGIACIGTKDEVFAWGVADLRNRFGDAAWDEIAINDGQLRHPNDKNMGHNAIHYFTWRHGESYR